MLIEFIYPKVNQMLTTNKWMSNETFGNPKIQGIDFKI